MRRALAGYPHGQAAVTEATAAALAHAADAAAMLLVEGVSDQIAVEALAARRGHELRDHRAVVVPTGGAGGIGRVLAEHSTTTQRLVALCDVGEEALVRRAITASGRTVSLFVCLPDLEAELIAHRLRSGRSSAAPGPAETRPERGSVSGGRP